MIQVKAPEDWNPPKAPKSPTATKTPNPSQATKAPGEKKSKTTNKLATRKPMRSSVTDPKRGNENETVETFSASFEDIDSILDIAGPEDAKPRTSKTKRRTTQPKTPTQTKKPAARKPSVGKVRPAPTSPAAKQAASPTDAQPILPGDDWTSAASKKRKKLAAMIAVAVGSIVLAATGIAAVLNYSKNNQAIAKNNESQTTTQTDIDSENAESDNTIEENGTNDDGSKDAPVATIEKEEDLTPSLAQSIDLSPQTISDAPPPLTDSTLTEPPPITNVPEMSDSPPDTAADSTQHPADTEAIGATNPDGPEKSPNRSPLDNLPKTGPFDNGAPNVPGTSPLAGNEAEPIGANNGLTSMSTLESQMGKLTELLKQSDTSIAKIRDVAELNRDQQLIGIPKYFIEKVKPSKIDNVRQLAMPCDGIRYAQVSLNSVLQDLNSITGVPFTLDTATILAHGVSLDPQISIDQAGTDFSSLIEEITSSLELGYSLGDHGIVLHGKSPEAFMEKTHTLPEFSAEAIAADAKQNFVAGIQALFAAESWVQAENPATIVLNGNQVTINNTELVHSQTAEFIEKINAAIRLTSDPKNQLAAAKLVTKWNAISSKLEQPTGLQKSVDLPILDWLEQIRQNTGVRVLVDWERIVPMGWSPATMVPGDIEEKDLETALRQVARSMNLTMRAIDEQTLQLTTFEKAAELTDLEVYHFGKVLSGPLKEPFVIETIRQTIGGRLQSPHVRFDYNSNCQSLIISAPQSIQKQVDAVVRQLESLGPQTF